MPAGRAGPGRRARGPGGHPGAGGPGAGALFEACALPGADVLAVRRGQRAQAEGEVPGAQGAAEHPGEKARLQADLDRALRVLDAIDAAVVENGDLW